MPRDVCTSETLMIGEHRVAVTPRKTCKRMVLRVDAKHNGFALSVPQGCLKSSAMSFLSGQKAWMDRMADGKLLDWTPTYAPGERHPFLGQIVTLGENGIPAGRAFPVARQRALEALIRQLLPVWQARMGTAVTAVRFRNMRSRWGSCQPQKKEIHLSTVLGEVPGECVEYVLVHELCHLFYADHGAGFHALLARHLPDWKARKDAMTRMDRRPMPPETK